MGRRAATLHRRPFFAPYRAASVPPRRIPSPPIFQHLNIKSANICLSFCLVRPGAGLFSGQLKNTTAHLFKGVGGSRKPFEQQLFPLNVIKL